MQKRKCSWSVILFFIFIFILQSTFVGASTLTTSPPISVGFVTDGQGASYFSNSQTWTGILKSGKEFNFKPELLVSKSNKYIKSNLAKIIPKKSLTIGVGYSLQNEIQQASVKYPNKSFAIIDAIVEKPNVESVLFKKNEGSFLAGVAAAKITRTGKIGFIGAYNTDIINEFLAGFKAGALSVNPQIIIEINYAETFDDISKLKKIALKQNSDGADIIMHSAGKAGEGLIQAADEKGFWAIGVDYDQYKLSKKNKVLCSVTFRYDVASYEVCKDFINGGFKGDSLLELGIKDGAVTIADGGKNLSSETSELVMRYRSLISENKIIVPGNLEELQKFEPIKID